MGWTWLPWLLVPLAILALLAGVLLVVRARALGRVVGSFRCAWREVDSQDWVRGVAVYGVDRLDWHRVVSLRPTPARRWLRAELRASPERRSLPGGGPGVLEVRCEAGSEEFYLALESAALYGLTSWLESSPPIDRGAA